MRLLALFLCLLAQPALAQSREVAPDDLRLEVTVADAGATPFTQEMVLITIRGSYRRHITRERLEQPPLDGFNWMQLGTDTWREEAVRGRPVKIFERRMALFPERAGRLEIGPFVHHLTLTDEADNWFDHDASSDPVVIEVAPAPATDGWWFPVRRLQISDQWSNAPDQLAPGAGVLRVIRLEAVGASPDMIPPMPELHSPSGMVFPHPEKRLVELSPEGPVTYAFWRWTVRPGNGASAILEPIEVPFFDTRERVARVARISAQRVAYEGAAPPPAGGADRAAGTARVPGWGAALTAGVAFVTGLAALLAGRRMTGRMPPALDPLALRLRARARAGDGAGLRRAAAAMLRRDGPEPGRERLLAQLDSALFAPAAAPIDLRDLARAFIAEGRRPHTNG